MPNIKSAKKRALQGEKRRLRNFSRKNAVRTAFKSVERALEEKDIERAKELLRDAESKMARAKGKKVIKAGTAERKVSRLAQKVAALARAE